MRTAQHSKSDWAAFDKDLRALIKDVLHLPKHATRGYLYGSTSDGCLGIPLAAFDAEVAHIDTGFKLLMSNDEIVKNLAWDDLNP